MRWPLQPLQPFQQTQLQPPFGQSVASLCHPWFTTTNFSYRFPIFETSATALCGTTGTTTSTTTSTTTTPTTTLLVLLLLLVLLVLLVLPVQLLSSFLPSFLPSIPFFLILICFLILIWTYLFFSRSEKHTYKYYDTSWTNTRSDNMQALRDLFLEMYVPARGPAKRAN